MPALQVRPIQPGHHVSRADHPEYPLPEKVSTMKEGSVFFREGCWAEPGNKRPLFAFTAAWCSVKRKRRYCPKCWVCSSRISPCSEPGDKYDGDIDMDLVRPLQRPPSLLITAQKPSRLRILGIGNLSNHRRWPEGSKWEEVETCSVTAEGGGVHECSWMGIACS